MSSRLQTFIALLVLLGGQGMVMALSYATFRAFGRAVYRSDGDESEKMHRYRQFWIWYVIASAVGVGSMVVVFASVSDTLLDALTIGNLVVPREIVLLVVSASILLSALLVLVAGHLGTYTYLRRVRDLEISGRRVAVRTFKAWGWKFGVVWVGLMILLEGPRGSRALLLGTAWLAYYAASPWFFAQLNETRPAEEFPDCVELLEVLSEDFELSVRGPIVLETEESKNGYAAVAGLLPGRGYLVVSDYLLENLSPEALEAVVLHELAHVKRHVPLLVGSKVLPPVAWVAAYEAGIDGIVLLGVVLIIPYYVVRGLIAHRAEYAADAFAAEHAGSAAMVRALHRLGELNALKDRTGRVYDLLALHPSLEKRVLRLQTR